MAHIGAKQAVDIFEGKACLVECCAYSKGLNVHCVEAWGFTQASRANTDDSRFAAK
jgi:hypothetical protein